MSDTKITVTKDNIQYDINKDDKWFGRAMGAFAAVSSFIYVVSKYPQFEDNMLLITQDLGIQNPNIAGVASLALTAVALGTCLTAIPISVSKAVTKYHAYQNGRAYINVPK